MAPKNKRHIKFNDSKNHVAAATRCNKVVFDFINKKAPPKVNKRKLLAVLFILRCFFCLSIIKQLAVA